MPDRFELLSVRESTPEFGNYDVAVSGNVAGRLYVLPVPEELAGTGIVSEWFITKDGTIQSGYIDAFGQWSLSESGSVEPSQVYTEQVEIFLQVFDVDGTEVAVEETVVVEKTATVATVVAVEEMLAREIRVLEELPVVMSATEGVANETFKQATFTQEPLPSLQEVWSTARSRSTQIEAERMAAELAAIRQLIELDRLQLKKMAENDSGDWWIVVEADRIIIFDPEDGHTVLASTWDGEVLSPLSVEDAQVSSRNLAQLTAILGEIEVEQVLVPELDSTAILELDREPSVSTSRQVELEP